MSGIFQSFACIHQGCELRKECDVRKALLDAETPNSERTQKGLKSAN